MDDENKLPQKALQHLFSRVETDGVAAVKVRDGEIFLFSRKKIMDLIETMDKNGENRCMVFVQTGPVVGETPEN